MIRLFRLFTGPHGRSHVEQTTMWLDSDWLPANSMRFQQSLPGSKLDWHDTPKRQYIVTLTGRLEFTTRDGETVRLGAGDVLLAEDTAGGGHSWRLLDNQPWTRVYIIP